MAVTYANTQVLFRANWTEVYTEVTLDSSYASGGEEITAAQFGFKHILSVNPLHAEGYICEPVRSSDTSWLLKVYTALTPDTNSALSSPQQSSTGRDLSTVTIPCRIIGR